MGTRIQQGFTLVELMIVVAIIGIMAAIALPAYNEYTIRTKVSELVLATSGYKVAVTEKAQTDGTLTSAGAGLTVTLTGKVSGGSITDGGVITVAGNAATVGTAVSVTLTPSAAVDGKLIWVCSTDATAFKFVPAECRH